MDCELKGTSRNPWKGMVEEERYFLLEDKCDRTLGKVFLYFYIFPERLQGNSQSQSLHNKHPKEQNTKPHRN